MSNPNRTGLVIVGLRGSVASTVIHGLEALRAGTPPLGLVTELEEFESVPWTDLGEIHAVGWDVAGNSHRTAENLERTGVLPSDLVDLGASLRDRLELNLAPGIPEPEDEELADPKARERLGLPAVEMVEALRGDIQSWRESQKFKRMVVVNLATAERTREIPKGWDDSEGKPLELLPSVPADFPRSLLYGMAAVAEGVPFVNFTPAMGAEVPAFAGWARREGVPLLGNDGKTGETLMKSALAPMFRDRALRVLAWEGYNMLGNRDGAALEDPDRKARKVANKDGVLRGILGDQGTHSGVSIDFVPSLHDWKTAMDFIHFEGFLGTKMQLQFTWQGSDSALAAPLVLDLARLALLAKERGQGGPLTAAAAFFKNPAGTDEHDFHRQMAELRAWLRR